jgi:hypothetical protein
MPPLIPVAGEVTPVVDPPIIGAELPSGSSCGTTPAEPLDDTEWLSKGELPGRDPKFEIPKSPSPASVIAPASKTTPTFTRVRDTPYMISQLRAIVPQCSLRCG